MRVGCGNGTPLSRGRLSAAVAVAVAVAVACAVAWPCSHALASPAWSDAEALAFAERELGRLAALCDGPEAAAGQWRVVGHESEDEYTTEHKVAVRGAPELRSFRMVDPATGRTVVRQAWVPTVEERSETLERGATFRVSAERDGAGATFVATVARDMQGHYALTRLTSEEGHSVCGHSAGGTGTAGAVRALSVNLWNLNHFQERLELLSGELRAVDADLVGFQEVRARRRSPRGWGRQQVSDLARLLPGYQFAFAAAMTFEEHGQSEAGAGPELHSEGVAVFSRLPVEEVGVLRLTQDQADGDDFHRRVCVWARVRGGDGAGPFLFMSTHLSLSAAARARTLEEIGRFAAAQPLPVVLVGDFNAEFTGGERCVLEREHGFVDAWRWACGERGGGEACADGPDGHTFNAWSPSKRIDYVMVRGAAVEAAGVAGTDPVVAAGLAPAGGVDDTRGLLYASDHLFPWADVRVGGAGQIK